ncbi:hypothetical protein [Nocardioides halotolerans]|nr:hypothetical protein [Nocardioides halotolerans]
MAKDFIGTVDQLRELAVDLVDGDTEPLEEDDPTEARPDSPNEVDP